jgi:hypothetical protein
MTHHRVRYACEPAEHSSLEADCVDLVVAAQAAHWFDMPAFCAEVQRVAHDGALVALVTYGLHRVDAGVDAVISPFYTDVLGPWWPPERRHVETGYHGLMFPFEPVELPALSIERDWNLTQLLAYVDTWSATQALRRAEGAEAIQQMAAHLSTVWGDPTRTRRVHWPLTIRAGRVRR